MRILLVILMLLASATATVAEELSEAALLRQGTAFLETRDYRKAVQAFAQAARANPQSVEAHRGLGLAYYLSGAGDAATDVEVVDKAIAEFREVLKISPDAAEIRFKLGVALLLVGDKGGATVEYQALKQWNATLAEELHSRISSYKSPKSFKTLVSPGVTDDTQRTRVTMAGDAVLVPVTFTHGVISLQATLLLDTGATVTMITKELATRLGIDLGQARQMSMVVADGRSVQGWHTTVDRIAVGPKSKGQLDVSVVQAGGTGFPFDGLLGMNFLRNYKYSIDFAHQTINWSQ